MTLIHHVAEYHTPISGAPEPLYAQFLDTFGRVPTYTSSFSFSNPLGTQLLNSLFRSINLSYQLPDEELNFIDLPTLLKDRSTKTTVYTSASAPDDDYASHTAVCCIQLDGGVIVRLFSSVPNIAAGEVHVASDMSDRENSYVAIATTNDAVFKTFHATMTDIRNALMITRDSSVNVVVQTDHGSLSLVPCSITVPTYIPGTHIEHEHAVLSAQISQQIAQKQRGIVLFHGAPGTGKTSFVRKLVRDNPGREFIIMPPEIFEQASSPTFLRFMLTRCQNAILIIEDAERVLVKRAESDSSIGISTLLNMGDGLLSDVLSTPIICTFNMGVNDIDPAIQRSGRLIKRHEFKPLSEQDVKSILEHSGHTYTGKIGSSVTVADVYQAIGLLDAPDDDTEEGVANLLGKTASSFGFR